jgi:hypothetical protein
MLDNIVLNNANPNMRAAFVSGISADAAAASGYKEGVDTLASSSIGRA